MHQRAHMGHCARISLREVLLTMTGSVVLLSGLPSSADAFLFNNWQPAAPQPQFARPAEVTRTFKPPRRGKATPKPTAADAKESKETNADVAVKAKGVLTVVISLDKQRLTLYSDGQPVAQSRVSTGTASHPTPTGVFSVIQKDRWHRSNIYDNAPMFYMQRITWSGVAMHQGIVPNQPASHGCIRLPEAFARQMWGTTKLGARVIIARGDVAPVAIANPRLFTLKREPLEAKGEPGASDVIKAAHGALEVARLGAAKPTATATDAKPADSALDAMAYAARKPRDNEVSSSEVVKSAYDVFEAPKVRRARTSASTTNNGVADVPALKPGPISVFISRKEGKLFVRKGFEPMFSVPVTFEQPERPIGTHVFTALALKEDNTTLRWHVVSLSSGGGYVRRSGNGKRVMEPMLPASNPNHALERVTIPPVALDRISELMSPGASLIISDQGLGPETGLGTDFIVLTR